MLAPVMVALVLTGAPSVERVRLLRATDPSLGPEQAALATEPLTLGADLNLGWTTDVAWYRFELHGEPGRAVVLDAAREWVEHADLYAVEGRRAVLLARSGSEVRPEDRSVVSAQVAFALTLPQSGQVDLLLRLESRSPVAFHARVYEAGEFARIDATERWALGFYLGILIAIGALSFMLFLALRERPQASLAAVLVSFAVGELASHGGLGSLWPAGTLSLGSAAFAVFSFAFIDWVWRALAVAEWNASLSLMLRWWRYLVPALVGLGVVPRLHALTYIGLTLNCVLMLVVTLFALGRRIEWAGHFLLAMLSVTSLGLVAIGTFFGLLPLWRPTELAAHLGTTGMALVLARLVAAQLRQARARSQALATELRYQVTTRSRELTSLLARQAGAIEGPSLLDGALVAGRYVVSRRLGQGGWGIVYEVARQPDGERFALKMLRRAESGADAARLAREAELGLRVRHPHLVPVFDVGVTEVGLPYAVMELMSEGSLEAKRPSFGKDPALRRWLAQAARGLAALHAEGVLHRDLKPANVLLTTRNGELVACVSDLGIARPADVVDSPVRDDDTFRGGQSLSPSPSLTQHGAILGTPFYMAPESLQGATTASDVFSFGVMAFEVLTGAAPFDDVPLRRALAGLPPQAPRAPTGLSARLRDALVAAVDGDPSRRPPIGELARALASNV